MGLKISDCPSGVPGFDNSNIEDENIQFQNRRSWHRFLTKLTPDWNQAKLISQRFKTSLPPPHNPWFLDLPIEWVPPLLKIIGNSKIEDLGVSNTTSKDYGLGLRASPISDQRQLRIIDGAKNWSSKMMDEIPPENISKEMLEKSPGISNELLEPIFSKTVDEAWTLIQHGLAKGSALILGLAHHHDGDDLIITSGWPAVLEAFGFSID
jgi:hypothetical protein